MRTSMIVHWPAGMADGSTRGFVRQPVAVFDLAPTCYEAAGANYPDTIGDRILKQMDGVSLLPLIRDETMPSRNLCYAYKDYRVVRNDKWKLLGLFTTRKDKPGDWHLFDLTGDQSETIDVADKYPEVVEQLSDVWDAWDEDVGVTEGYKEYWSRKAEKAREE